MRSKPLTKEEARNITPGKVVYLITERKSRIESCNWMKSENGKNKKGRRLIVSEVAADGWFKFNGCYLNHPYNKFAIKKPTP